MRFLVLGMLVLAGCAGNRVKKFDEMLQAWLGHNISETVAAWGAPSQVMPLPDKSQVYKFAQVGGSQTSFDRGLATTNTWYCNITFITDAKGIIQKYQWEGNSCRAQ